MVIFSCESYAEKVKLRGEGITDDEIANAIKSPRPLSVSKAINHVESKYKADEIEVLDFRNNNITSGGARKILEFAQTLPNLKKLSFNTNRIYDWRGQEGFEDFEKALLALLDNPNFETLDIRTNAIANLSWYKYIAAKTENAYKIKWKK
ncbi:MAG: hypothetical protein ACP5OE_09525 [Thermodesulfobium sp.]